MKNRNGVRLGRIFGVELDAHWSLLIIFVLVAASLGGAVLPGWHPDWSGAMIWSVAIAAALFFFASIALHELSHALVGRKAGLEVERITLFLFGGVAHTRREPRSPAGELATAAIGPLVSLAVGLGATFAALAMLPAIGETDDAAAVIAGAGPLATLLLWLGPINILLAAFNMVPGFPLDGGRVARAALWWITGDRVKATRWSAAAGNLFGWVLIGAGVLMVFGVQVPIFGRGPVGGMWLILIGWFLGTAARASYAEVEVRSAVAGVPVRAMMRTRVTEVEPDTSVESLVSEHLMHEDQRGYPVTRDGELVGMVCVDDIRKVSPDRWPQERIGSIMTKRSALATLAPDDAALEALELLATEDVNQLPVIEDRALRGMVCRADILKWLSLRSDAPAIPA